MIYKSQGFSFLEILITMALGLIVLVGISQVYLNFKKIYHEQENIARLQENGRFATYILVKNISMAGYGGCLKTNLPNAVTVYTSTNLPSYLQGKVVKGTDVIVIKKADQGVTHLTKNIDSPTNTITVENNPATTSNPQLFISDCKKNHAIKFESTSFGNKYIKTTTTLNNYDISDTEVAQYIETAYFIGATSHQNTALYSMTNQKNKEELIDGITNMQIKYNDKLHSVDITLTLDAGDNKIKPWKIYIAIQPRTWAQY
jgi:type IV pilus assembly protein PilW